MGMWWRETTKTVVGRMERVMGDGSGKQSKHSRKKEKPLCLLVSCIIINLITIESMCWFFLY